MGTWNPEFFQTIMGPFVANSQWFGNIFTFAGPIYWMMATIALGWVLLSGFINRDAAGCAADLGFTIMGLGAGWVLFQNAAPWAFDLYNTLSVLGTEVGGLPLSALAPDGLMVIGYQIASTIWNAVGFMTWLHEPISSVIILLMAVVIFVLYLLMAINLMLLIIESFFAIVGGTIFIPFGAFHWTRNLLLTWFSWILGTGIQLFFTYLVLSVGLTLETEFLGDLLASTFSITTNLTVAATALAQAGVFWTLLVFIPRQARKRVDASVSPSLGSGSVMGVLGAAISTGAAVGSAASSAASAAANVGSTHSQQVFSRMMSQP